MDDVISRQAAIDLVEGLESARLKGEIDLLYPKVVKGLIGLPSAQPEQAVKGCRNCKYGKYNDHWKTNFCYNPNDCTEWNLWEPSAQPEQKLGRWVDDGDPLSWVCSECGYRVARYNNTPYCPNCGAKMINARGEQDEYFN